MTQTEELTYAYFFFTDIVGLSDPRIPTKRQIKKIEALTSMIMSCDAFKKTDPNLMLYLPTGDGMAIGFLSGPELPLMLAVELHKRLREYNIGKFPEEILRIRIGIGDGPVYIVKSMSDSNNLWGPGILLARSIMDLGDDDHILLSPLTAEALRELSDEYRELIRPVHDYKMKDGNTILVYSVYGDGIGNPEMPKKNLHQKRMMKSYVKKIKDTTLCNRIEVTLATMDPKAMLTRYKNFYNIENISDEPIQTFLHGITTRIRKKSFNDLNVRVLDKSGKQLRITSINFDKPYQKEFTISFSSPILKGEKDRGYMLEYHSEEPKRYYEEHFNLNCRKYSLSFIYPSDAGFKPILYDMGVENKRRTNAKIRPIVQEAGDGLLKATWTKTDVIENQAFRLEW